MKQYVSSLWIIGAMLFVLAGCKKDPFEGTDNYITSFAFQVDEKVYPAIIKNNEIKVAVPSNVLLEKATVKYTLSELATINPKPESVKDWSNKQQFAVKAHNGKEMQYTVQVVRDDVGHKGDVILITNKDVEEFAARGINVIDGNLTIGADTGTDSITHIDALQKLQEVKYTLRIGKTFKCENLNGLKNLKKVGYLIADLAPHSGLPIFHLKTIDLPSLEKVFGDVFIKAANTSVKSVCLPKLQSVEKLTIEAGIQNTLCLDALQVVNNMRINLTYSKDDQNSETPIGIEAMRFPNLTSSRGAIYLSGRSSEGNVKGVKVIDFPELETAGEFSIEVMPELTELKANKLKSVSGKLLIRYSPEWGDFSQINNIEQAGTIELSEVKTKDLMPLLSKLKTLENLKTNSVNYEKPQKIDLSNCQVSGEISLSKIWASEVVLPKDFKGKLYMYPYNKKTELPIIKGNSAGIIELNGFKKTETLSLPSFTFIFEISIKNFKKLQIIDLKSIKGEVGEIAINSCDELQKINLPGVSSAKTIKINGKKIQTIDMRGLKNVEQLDLQACKQLDNPIFTALTSITKKFSIGGSWSGYQNEVLKNLNGFSALTTIKEMEIQFSPLLTDFSGLKKAVQAGGITAKNWNAHDNGYNPTFEDLKAGRYVKP